MTIKRALLALIAMMLLPALVYAQPTPPPITPVDGTANIAVALFFDDGNDEDSVLVNISCSSGTISPSFATLSTTEGQIFVIDKIPDGPDTSCTVTAVETDDYTAGYLCAPNGAGASTDCQNPSQPYAGTSCQFDDVNAYTGNGTADSVGYCIIENSPSPVDVDVHKVWEMVGSTQADVDQDVRITLVCDGEIVGGSEVSQDKWKESIRLKLDKGDYDDEEGDYTGMGTATFEVIPDFYSTAAEPEDQEYTTCFAKENVKDSYVEIDNGCGDSFKTGTIMVAAGMGDECTITNTVFFEGIPTLNQYGMAIMALLMLGVGFVGFRRFV